MSVSRVLVVSASLLGGCGSEATWGGEVSFFREFFESAGGGFEVLDLQRGEEVETCIVEWESRFVSQPTDCPECQFAFELEYGEPEVEVEVDGACGLWETELAAIPGTRISIGYGGGERLWVLDGERWVARGYAEYAPQEEFVFELEPEDE